MKSQLKKISFVAALFFAGNKFSFANPTGLTVVSGSATAQPSGLQLNVTTSQSVFLNWSSFNIQPGETTTFIQPSVNSIAINEIGGASPSQIFGSLNANGTVILANANGFYFGPNSMISVGGSFIATTAPLTPDFGAGSAWQFTGMPPLASVVNYGQIEVGNGKSLFLIAEDIENHGGLDAAGGTVGLYAGENVLVSDRPDGRGLSATVQVPNGSVNNFGQITADAGTIALQAQVVNQNGIIQADSVQNQNGVIELVAADQLDLGANSQILARGDNSAAGSAGGNITLQSGNNFSDSVGSTIITIGGSQGGNGGNIEISAPNIQSLNSSMAASAQSGWSGGIFFLDPANIALGTSSTYTGTPDNSGTVAYNSGSGTLDINVNTAFKSFSQILLQAAGNITLNTGTMWNLSGSTSESSGQLTLEAGGNITFGNNSKIQDANDWSVTLAAGYNFNSGTIQSGTGYIYLNGGSGLSQSGTIQLSAGSINLLAGESILVGSGSVFTTGGGSIYADALAGDINAGTSNGSSTSGGTQTSDYLFTPSGSIPNAILGGLSTAAGGNVTLIAGDDVVSVPIVPTEAWPGASGAYGAGNVTVIAGNQITGNYTLANGIGTLFAGVQVQGTQASVLQNPSANPMAYATTLNSLETEVTQNSSGNGNIGNVASGTGPVTLSLIQGSWNVWAANNIYINEVNNPNGTFNSDQSFLFNYAPDAAVNFWAGNAIDLAGAGADLTRVSRQNQSMPPIYAPILTLNAGAGGVTIDNSIILDPSSEGLLQITTRNGGDLIGLSAAGTTTLTGITMSDSGAASWATFATGQAATPLYLNNPNPVTLDISGSIGNFGLTVPTFADITVDGMEPFVTSAGQNIFGTYNFGFIGQNLSPAQTTSIHVTGSITYRGDLTSETLPSAISASAFDAIIGGDPSLAGALSYDATTGTISFIGVMSSAIEQSLLNPTDANGNAIFTGAQLTAWQTTIAQLDASSQSASLGDNGLMLSGPGNFNISANSIDLGISSGISVLAPINVATSVTLTDPLPSALLNPAQSGDSELASKLFYNSATGTLAFDGVMSPAEFAFLLNPTEVVLNATGNPVTQSVTLDAAQLSAINQLYTDNKNDVLGANINVTTVGDLEMTSTEIANESLLGGITLNVGGTLDVGGELTAFGGQDSPKGIFTTSGGNIDVTATGDVNVDGSRIAAYDGGNIAVESETGDVNAGTGGEGYVVLNALQIDPTSGQLVSIPATIPGSGILATTIFGSDALLGDITVNAPNGSINANLGGIIQISFDNANPQNSFIELNAGDDINATGSGVIGSNIKLQAGGDINGIVIGSQSVNINSAQNVNVTAVSGGDVSINASGEVAGTVIGGGSVNVSGDSITASLIASSVSASGDTTGANVGVPQSNVSKDVAQTADDATTTSKTDDTDDDLKKKGRPISLAQKVSRVTVLLPGKD